MDAMRNIIFDACIIRASNRGLGIQNRDEGCIEDVIFSNCIVESRLFADVWWGKAEPIYITAFKRAPNTPYRFQDGKTEGKIGKVRRIRFSNILCNGESGVFVSGCPDSRIEDVVFDQVRVAVDKTPAYPSGVYDRRPCDVDGIIVRPTAGFYLNEADGIVLRDCRVVWGEHRPEYYGCAVQAHDVTQLEIENLKGTAAQPDRDAPISIDSIADCAPRSEKG
jgi:hypothetical protein